MSQVLDDPQWLQSLRDYGLRRATAFTWDSVAQRALDALTRLQVRSSGMKSRRVSGVSSRHTPIQRPRNVADHGDSTGD